MKQIYIIQNDPEVPCGSLDGCFTGIQHCIHRAFCSEPLPDIGHMGGLIVLGGAMGANDDAQYPFLPGLRKLILQVVKAEIPYLGICLGGQLLAAAFGAEVVSNRWQEFGTLQVNLNENGMDDPLFKGFEKQFFTFQWHNDSFDLPAGSVLLASSEACRHQAFRIGSRAWGLQFHPEVTEDIIRNWCSWTSGTAQQTDRMTQDFKTVSKQYQCTAQKLMYNFLTAAGGF